MCWNSNRHFICLKSTGSQIFLSSLLLIKSLLENFPSLLVSFDDFGFGSFLFNGSQTNLLDKANWKSKRTYPNFAP